MGISIPYERGELVFIVRRIAITHKEKTDLGYDHLGHRGYQEYTVTDRYEWEVEERHFYYGLLDEAPLDRIFKNRCSAQFRQIRLQAIDRREQVEQSRKA